MQLYIITVKLALMLKLVAKPDSKSGDESRAGSNPAGGTQN